MKRIVLVTGHYLHSKRRAGFHWLAESFHRAGWDVLFFTAPLSWLSWLRRDHRFQYPVREEANRLIQVDQRLTSYVWMTNYHPANMRLATLNRLFDPIFERYAHMPLGPAEPLIADADLIVFESTPGLLLFDRFRALAPSARIVYRVSDDLRLLRNHPRVLETEKRIVPQFDLVSVPCRYIQQRLGGESVALHHHGLQRELFEQPVASPYSDRWACNAVFVGNDHLDREFLSIAAAAFPTTGFHVIGPFRRLPKAANIIAYGELPFEETIAYVKHADIGLHAIEYRPGAESFSDTLKVLQYSYCRLPVIAPAFIESPRSNFVSYVPGDATSIAEAVKAAAAFDRALLGDEHIATWSELAEALAGEPLDCRGDVTTINRQAS